MANHFIKPVEHYKRDLDVVNNYKRDMSLFLHKRTGKSLEECVSYVEAQTKPGGKFELKDPQVMCLTRGDNGDRKTEVVGYTDYLDDITRNRRLFSPAMTVYVHPKQKQSVLAEYIEGNIAGRSKVKKEGIEAKMAGNEELAALKENEQTTYKIANNSLSGGQASHHTILYNKSAHSSLTSTCRSATSYGNANNEKFLLGNRHYWAPDVVKANIISIIGHTDYELLQKAIDTYGLVYPSVEQTMDCINYSTDLYWRNQRQSEEIRLLIKGLTDIERASFVYTADLYHLAQFNEDVVRRFLKQLSTKATTPIDNPIPLIDSMDADLTAFVSLLCSKDLAGRTIKDVKKSDPHVSGIIGATVKNIQDCLDEWQLLIRALWVSDNVPASVAYIRNSVRRTAVTSDTDSTIFTVQDWVKWYCGEISFSDEAYAIDYTMVYLSTQSIIHVLALLSTTLGVVEEKLNVLAMKNEYAFPVFSLTSMAKHYYAYMSAREGNVFKELDTEVKGVYLKDSNCPPEIMKEVNKTICGIMDTVMAGKKISINAIYRNIAQIENNILESVKKGDSRFLAGGQVKSANSYVKPSQSPFVHYEMWEEVFAPVYGNAPEPPYRAIKVSLDMKNQTQLWEWVDAIADEGIRERLRTWLKRGNKTGLTSLLLPRPIVEVNGLPKEVIDAMNIRKLIYSTVRPFYLVLESLGVYMVNDHNTRLVSDVVKSWETSSTI